LGDGCRGGRRTIAAGAALRRSPAEPPFLHSSSSGQPQAGPGDPWSPWPPEGARRRRRGPHASMAIMGPPDKAGWRLWEVRSVAVAPRSW